MFEYLKGWGSIIIAAVALIQPWAIALWKKFFRRGSIDIHETGTIEVGYSAFGPTIGLNGTLHAVHRDLFVRSIDLSVVKLKDSSRHSFEWGVFRAQKWSIGGAQEMSLDLATGFMVTVPQPQRYNILFVDRRAQEEIRPHMEKVRQSWTTTTLQAGTRQFLQPGADIPRVNEAIRQLYRRALC